MEKVSFIVPVYNGESRLRRCVESILNQDYPEIELILVDDGSKDCSLRLMEEYAAMDRRVRAIHKPNGGVSSARNRAFAEASGRYIQFADVDDWLPMDATKLLVRELEASGAELVVGDFYRVVEQNVAQKGSIEKGGVLSRLAYADAMLLSPADLYYGVLWNKLYRREIIERYALRMDEAVRYSEDLIFNLEYLLHVENVAILKAPVYYYEYTKGSLVDQSLNLSSTVKMKANVIGYYTRFYRSILSPLDYQERLPVIYSYLLAVSKDSLALPFLPGTRRLDAQSSRASLLPAAADGTLLQSALLRFRLADRYLDTLSKKRGVERVDLQLLCALKLLGAPASTEALSDCAGLAVPLVRLSLARLLLSGLVSREDSGWALSPGELADELALLERDCEAICFEGLSERERAVWQETEARICANIRRRLSAEDSV